MLEKGLIVNSLLGDIPTATKQAEEREGVPEGLLVHVSKSNFNNFERALKKFKLQLGLNMTRMCTGNSSFSRYSLNDNEKH